MTAPGLRTDGKGVANRWQMTIGGIENYNREPPIHLLDLNGTVQLRATAWRVFETTYITTAHPQYRLARRLRCRN
jgi:hypothetical protein